jgi:hypothetical protein
MNYMDIIATIIVTVLITVAVIGLGLGIWAIVKLSRKVSNLESLREGYSREFESLHRRIDENRNNHEQIMGSNMTECYREFERLNSTVHGELKEVHRRIDETIDVNERNLDRRFDNAYRKINQILNKDNSDPTMPKAGIEILES